ncbi:hypothetical protein [Deinococcus soli (ex Cha et al. 2016)]|uniref:Uncharacterized protein n=2 Tax=Deinococcus soli (ex Cha et al. 2016) TaxID=1309411 RepID=A0ACC6KGB5_9DEIO|nr:hypothetical protein [Deinococcus soli (ex Cha et al. 2016)]MDR6218501.1 hypothetical protein [Deinococcus soli (ex Cha et al. 2016)]MDR6329241.1 hypothetical protein [Deinococcus soli (ex Cha et al. 2016)]MDR6751514.1 hypothetical protein [Deinococcus soli (ex Cha et al. 2016)]
MTMNQVSTLPAPDGTALYLVQLALPAGQGRMTYDYCQVDVEHPLSEAIEQIQEDLVEGQPGVRIERVLAFLGLAPYSDSLRPDSIIGISRVLYSSVNPEECTGTFQYCFDYTQLKDMGLYDSGHHA